MKCSAALSLILAAGLLAGAGVFGAGCASDKVVKNDKVDSLKNFEGPSFTASKQGEFIVESYTLDGSGEPNLIKYFEEYPDPENPKVTLRRLRKKEVDVNSDGKINIVRLYDQEGVPIKEKMDRDLDGKFDSVSYFDNGQVVRKESINPDGSQVMETRYYSGGTLIRVERAKAKEGQIDYWEYYEEGTLDRIGIDLNGDGRADSWTRR